MKCVSDIHQTLKRYWGFDTFRPQQESIIRSVIEGRDTLALMPTGGGKSLTYQLPTMVCEGLCIVITPLIALMKDQTDTLRGKGINAVSIHSGLTTRQIDNTLSNCVYGDVKFLYVSPERLSTEAFRLSLQRMNVSLIAVDEAHCISQWGYDFRPAYLHIADIRRLLPEVPILALTASATPFVADDIMNHLLFDEKHIIRSSFARKNLAYAVRHTDDKNGQLLRIINNVAGSGIVYVRLREGAEQLAEFLQKEGVAAEYYHGGLPNAERAIRQENWTSGRTRIMVATNAFGMGIDKADVRFVVHYTMCDAMESYYQEAGRAGRDDRRSYAVLLSASNDHRRLTQRFESEFPPIEDIKSIYEKICSYLQVAVGDGFQASFSFNIHDFCAREHIYIEKVRNAIKILSMNGYMTLTDERENPARLMFSVSRDDLYKIRIVHNEMDYFLRTLLRMYNGIFTEFKAISEGDIAISTGYTSEKVMELLKRLWQMRVVKYIPSNRSPMIFFNEERLPSENLYISPDTYRRRKEAMLERISQMAAYAENTEKCRSRILSEYFGDNEAVDCGICDICLARRKREKSFAAKSGRDLESEVTDALKEGKSMKINELAERLKCDATLLPQVLAELHAKEICRTLGDGTIHLKNDTEE
ncbi:MAG: RecQ family ATP-dependent DNA helicase [Alistipes sp.]|nr:RecQ family ATP-dependent DNA helicase [Alistipes sp.]